MSVHVCLPVSVCRSHLLFPASSHVPFIPFRPALSMDLGVCRATRQREAPPHAKYVRIEVRINDCLYKSELANEGGERARNRTSIEEQCSKAIEEQCSKAI